jgi:hypothetical protein
LRVKVREQTGKTPTLLKRSGFIEDRLVDPRVGRSDRLGHPPPTMIYRPAARDHQDPGQQAGPVGIIRGGALPDLEENMLQGVLGGAPVVERRQEISEAGSAVPRIDILDRPRLASREATGKPAIRRARRGPGPIQVTAHGRRGSAKDENPTTGRRAAVSLRDR